MRPGAEPERWVPVFGYEGIYEVSDIGRVRSLDRRDNRGRFRRGVILKRHVWEGGHLAVVLCKHGTERFVSVHRTALESFVGPAPEGTEGCHNDGNPANNKIANLRWDTHAENMRDQARHGTNSRSVRTHCPRDHALIAPNLRASSLRRGQRECRSCDLERKASNRERRTFDASRATARYDQLIQENQ